MISFDQQIILICTLLYYMQGNPMDASLRVFEMQRINSFGGNQQQSSQFTRNHNDRRNIFSSTMHSQPHTEPKRKRYWSIFGKYRPRNSPQSKPSASTKLLASSSKLQDHKQQKITIGVNTMGVNTIAGSINPVPIQSTPSFMSFQPILGPPSQIRVPHSAQFQLLKLQLQGYRRCEKISQESEHLYSKLVDKIKKHTQRQIEKSRRDKENTAGQSAYQNAFHHHSAFHQHSFSKDHNSSKPQLYQFNSQHKYNQGSIGRESYLDRQELLKERKEDRHVQSAGMAAYQQALSPFTLHQPISPQQHINQNGKKYHNNARHANQLGQMNRMIEMYGWRWKRADKG